MITPNTQYLCGYAYFLTDDYLLNRPGAHDHMLMIANCSNLDHLLSAGSQDNY
ncbi:peptidase [Superficieibacter electus]|uniref:Peptidase n=1 Tax=Superficieibacter electus TaxID=2022662 RepID=A0A2P5GM23_9ENTR|nr:peptidase [Superficieibacter electus]POP46592.1 peptidase [Superficieibacter electus]